MCVCVCVGGEGELHTCACLCVCQDTTKSRTLGALLPKPVVQSVIPRGNHFTHVPHIEEQEPAQLISRKVCSPPRSAKKTYKTCNNPDNPNNLDEIGVKKVRQTNIHCRAYVLQSNRFSPPPLHCHVSDTPQPTIVFEECWTICSVKRARKDSFSGT